jgi:hypothetical protein
MSDLGSDCGGGPAGETASDHLTPVMTDRGFQHMPKVQAVHGGQPSGTVQVYESSAASGPYIWLEVIEQEGHEVKMALAHLPLDEAVKLRQQLSYLTTNHYQLGGVVGSPAEWGGAREGTE